MSHKNVRDSYKLYKKTNKDIVNIDNYFEYANNFNRFLIEKILHGEIVTLPARLGTLGIQGKMEKVSFRENGKLKGLAPDWVKTKKLWDSNEKAKEAKKIIYHTNDKTQNTRYKFFWSKKMVIIENKTLYALRMTRANKRLAHEYILKGTQYKTRN